MLLNINEVLTNHVCAKHTEERECICPLLLLGHAAGIRLSTCAKWKQGGDFQLFCNHRQIKVKLSHSFPADVQSRYRLSPFFFFALYFTRLFGIGFPYGGAWKDSIMIVSQQSVSK